MNGKCIKKILLPMICGVLATSPAFAQTAQEEDEFPPVSLENIQQEQDMPPAPSVQMPFGAEMPPPAFDPREKNDNFVQKNGDAQENWATDARPFKRRANGAKRKTVAAPVIETFETPQQIREKLGSPHEMSDIPDEDAVMPHDFSVMQSERGNSFYNQPQRRRGRPALAANMPKRGGAGGVARPLPVADTPRPRPTAATAAKSGGAPTFKEASKERFVQEGLKMFDAQTAKDVMNVQPTSKDLENLSPEERQKLLDSVDVNQKSNAAAVKSAAKEQGSAKKSKTSSFKNIKDNPYNGY